MTNYEKVVDFHATFGHPVAEVAGVPPQELVDLRISLIQEEFMELFDAVATNNIVEMADALTDMLYVIYGFGAVAGINLDLTFAEVHRSNMSKLGADGKPVLREDGKILKGPNYSPPDLSFVLEN